VADHQGRAFSGGRKERVSLYLYALRTKEVIAKKMSAIGGHFFLMLAGSYFLQQSDFFSGQGVPLPHLMPLASQAFMQASLHWPPP
jgi:hypothetical protein